MRYTYYILLAILCFPICDVLTICVVLTDNVCTYNVWGQEVFQQPYLESARIQAIERGLKYLKARQKSNGSFGDGYYEGDAAVTALAGMAFMSSGDVGESADSPTAKCVDYLLSIACPDGFINRSATADADGSFRPMYGHGFATLFLAEMAGMYKEEELLPKLDKAVQLIIASQNEEGGWRYFPVKKDADVSVTACQVIALRAARNAGRDVPAQTIDKAVKYLLDRQNSDGGFMYMSPSGESALPRSVAVVAALYCAGLTNDNPAIVKAWKYLESCEKRSEKREARSEKEGTRVQGLETRVDSIQSSSSFNGTIYPYYTAYYLSGSICFIERDKNGERGNNGERSEKREARSKISSLTTRNSQLAAQSPIASPLSTQYRNDIVEFLISSQNPDGSWSSEFSKDYATAMALIVLQLENNYLPVWQR